VLDNTPDILYPIRIRPNGGLFAFLDLTKGGYDMALRVLGDNPLRIGQGELFADPGVRMENDQGNEMSGVRIERTILESDPNQPNRRRVLYRAIGARNRVVGEAERTVIVEPSDPPPPDETERPTWPFFQKLVVGALAIVLLIMLVNFVASVYIGKNFSQAIGEMRSASASVSEEIKKVPEAMSQISSQINEGFTELPKKMGKELVNELVAAGVVCPPRDAVPTPAPTVSAPTGAPGPSSGPAPADPMLAGGSLLDEIPTTVTHPPTYIERDIRIRYRIHREVEMEPGIGVVVPPPELILDPPTVKSSPPVASPKPEAEPRHTSPADPPRRDLVPAPSSSYPSSWFGVPRTRGKLVEARCGDLHTMVRK
jgi:hypothetical protein